MELLMITNNKTTSILTTYVTATKLFKMNQGKILRGKVYKYGSRVK